MNNLGRNIAIWLIIGAALMALFNMFQTSETNQSASKMAYTDFIAQAKSGGITDVLIEGNNLKGRTRENATVFSYKPDGADVVATLEGTDVLSMKSTVEVRARVKVSLSYLFIISRLALESGSL